jgi:histone deacetylase complex regulatory component SIN3
VRTVKLRFSGDQSHVYEAFLDIMRDFKSGRYVPLSR